MDLTLTSGAERCHVTAPSLSPQTTLPAASVPRSVVVMVSLPRVSSLVSSIAPPVAVGYGYGVLPV